MTININSLTHLADTTPIDSRHSQNRTFNRATRFVSTAHGTDRFDDRFVDREEHYGTPRTEKKKRDDKNRHGDGHA